MSAGVHSSEPQDTNKMQSETVNFALGAATLLTRPDVTLSDDRLVPPSDEMNEI